ncbi:DUF3810 domain-containing protein [Anaerosporobacter faecicola]|uniref:DUF3810 domain-containing protein n=1 Tax=Anaerosporobacter faecicola TaxID=2718714 RepID=UPI00143A938F|nr:DUF3810 domain-containing protein [Anaerosporobacter faecicola]
MKELRKKKRIWLLLLLPLGLFILLLVRWSPFVAEYWFSRGIYRVVEEAYCFITGLVPISIAEILLYLSPFLLIYVVFRMVRKLVREKEDRQQNLARYVLNLLCIVSTAFFLFMVLCGVNYYRYPFSRVCGLTVETYSIEELYGLCEELAAQANVLRAQITSEDEAGVFQLSTSDFETAKEAKKAMTELGKQYASLSGYYSVPKPVLASRAMSYTDTTGLFVTITMEANINVDVADYGIPATMCHELAHQKGYMRENEANYIAYLACMNSDNIEFQYSGTMDALSYATSQLYDHDVELYKQIREQYSDEVLADRIANSQYWKTYHNAFVSSVSSKLNDAYLKANNQTSGEQSYGEMIDLLLAQYRKTHSKN